MKKFLGLFLAGALAIGTCMMVFAAPPTEAPSEMSVAQDGKSHSVYVFGTVLALVFQDGSVSVSSMDPVGRVDVMMDGVVIKNVASVDVPADQKTKMAFEKGSVIVINVTAESGEAIKKQIDDAFAAGADSIDLASLTDVAAYKVNEDGNIVDADGKAIPANVLGVSIASVDATVKSFGKAMEEIIAEDKAREAAAQRAADSSSGDTPSTVPSSSGSSATPAPTSAATSAPTATPTATTTESPDKQ